MNILVCVKRVPAPGARINITDDGQAVDTAFLGFTVSPHEECAVEQAVQLVEKHGGEVTVLKAQSDSGAWVGGHVGKSFAYGITLKGSDTVIGLFQVRSLTSRFDIAEWGFALGSAFWGTGVFMDAALEILPPDLWRWYLTANSPEGSDTAFTWISSRAR